MAETAAEFERIAFVASDSPEAGEAASSLRRLYGTVPVENADVIVALGGDGLMLQTLHRDLERRGNGGAGRPCPIYGMNRGSVGFLMNEYREDDLLARLGRAERTIVHPLAMRALDRAGKLHDGLAINEVSLFRERHQAAKLRISIDGTVRLDELICDGALVATPAGSTAYNFSAHGPILPIHAPLLALTPISPFRPRRWRGALLPDTARIAFDVLEADKRPVSAVADSFETRSVIRVEIEEAQGIDLVMLFDPGHTLDERILSEQFRY
jgi:NAD+ kinase